MKELQATAHLTAVERDAFDEYAREFFLDSAGLLALLFARQSRFGDFCEVIRMDDPPKAARATKITVRLKRVSEHRQLSELAKQAGVSLSHAGAALIRREIKERSLEAAVRDSIRVAM